MRPFHRRPLRAIVATFLAAIGCSVDSSRDWNDVKHEIRTRFPDVSQMDSDELQQALDGTTPPILLDARAKEEFDVSHLRGAISTPTLDAAREALQQTPPDRPIVVYCSVGYRSSQMAEQLAAAGFSDVHNYEGSIFEWVNLGRPVYRGDQEVKEVHPFNADWGSLLRRDRWSELTPR